MPRCATTYKSDTLTETAATDLYNQLVYSVRWHDGIRSRGGFTRKAYMVPPTDSLMPVLCSVIKLSLNALKNKQNYAIMGIYINYYVDGTMYAPNHSHKGSHQLVLSLGATRTLTVGKKEFAMNNGSSIIFGGSVHGVPKEPSVSAGRISIAAFLKPFNI